MIRTGMIRGIVAPLNPAGMLVLIGVVLESATPGVLIQG